VKIIQLDVKGYRSLYDIVWRPGDLNVVIGPNGSGKSNLLKVLDLLAVAARGRLGAQVQREGGMESLVWDGRASRMSFQLKTSPLQAGGDVERESLTYCLDMARLGTSSAYQIDHELLGNYYRVDRGEKEQPFKFIERTFRLTTARECLDWGVIVTLTVGDHSCIM